MSDNGGKYVCSGGFIISGMIVGSTYGATAGIAGGAPAIPGVVFGALGGTLWATAICTRPAVKRFFQAPIDKFKTNFERAVDVSGLRSELREFVRHVAPDVASNPEPVVAFMLEYLHRNRTAVLSLAKSNGATSLRMFSAEANQGMEILKTAKPLT